MSAALHPTPRRARLFLWALALALGLSALFACLRGSETIDLASAFAILKHRVLSLFGNDTALPDALQSAQVILEQLRLPRVALAACVGAALALAGCALQGIFRNPLADPSLLGVSSGAAVGASAALVFALPLLPLWAFVGGLAVTGALFQLSKIAGRVSVARMLLAGIAINALAGAFIGFMIFISAAPQLRDITFWSLGSLTGATWGQAGLLAVFTLAAWAVLRGLAPSLNALLLGEAEAAHLGVRTGRVQAWAVGLSALLVALSVACCGIISFLGLIAPHIARMLLGPDHRRLVPACALIGALILLWADTAARLLVSPAELPVGILTALLGAPFFLSLLWASRKKYLYFQ